VTWVRSRANRDDPLARGPSNRCGGREGVGEELQPKVSLGRSAEGLEAGFENVLNVVPLGILVVSDQLSAISYRRAGCG
jgi:hypothetical protein